VDDCFGHGYMLRGRYFCIYLKHSDIIFFQKNGGVFPEMAADVKKVLRRLDLALFKKKLIIECY
jgi:hypothetical protein